MEFDYGTNEEDINVLIQYKNVVDISNIVSKADLTGKITYVNQEFCRISGYSVKELIGQNHNIVKHPDMPSHVFADLWETICARKVWKGTIKNRAKNGDTYVVSTTIYPLLNSKDEIIEFISIRHDITELVNLRDKFKELSTKDFLTGIYNRCFFQSKIVSEIDRVKELNNKSCLILLDIDRFKQVNDRQGHDVGDILLVEFTKKVKEVIRKQDIFCRVGGDEFAILISDTGKEQAALFAEKIRKKIATSSFSHGERVTISFGITEFTDNDHPDIIYKNADRALYRAKQSGRNCVIEN